MEPNTNVPGIKTWSVDRLIPDLKKLVERGLQSILLFGVSDKKDDKASEAFNENSPVAIAIKEIREKIPSLIIGTDVALDPYTSHGHDGLILNGEVDNDSSVEALCMMAEMHAKCGAQMITPSDMMDGRVMAIRERLDEMGKPNTAIMAYTAKYCSAFYGPFRDTLQVDLQGDKKTYQMDPANRKEALKELDLDIAQGADIVMVKPAIHYLDVISDFQKESLVPVSAYHVSGEAAMLELSAKAGLCDRRRAIEESTLSIFRAGADMIASYFAPELLEWHPPQH